MHKGHRAFLLHAKFLGCDLRKLSNFNLSSNKLVVAVNSDASARRLKTGKWGEKYPIDSYAVRHANVARFADVTLEFDSEEELHEIIKRHVPCILCKGPDYRGRRVTGDDLAPVVILDTDEPESVKEMKRKVYAGES